MRQGGSSRLVTLIGGDPGPRAAARAGGPALFLRPGRARPATTSRRRRFTLRVDFAGATMPPRTSRPRRSPAPPKIATPSFHAVAPRPRLFRRLDAAVRKGAVWI